MRKLLSVVALIGFSPAAAFAQNAQPTVADYAANMKAMIGQEFEGGIVFSNVAAEANTLVLTIDGPPGWREPLTPQMISDSLTTGLCQSAANFFDSGIKLRVDSVIGKKDLIKGPLVDHCPATGK